MDLAKTFQKSDVIFNSGFTVIADSVVHRSFNSSFRAPYETYLNGDAQMIDFSGPVSPVDKANQFIETLTGGIFRDVYKTFGPARSVAINAGYFKAPWKYVFAEDEIIDDYPFENGHPGKTVSMMMHTSDGDWEVLYERDFTMVVLPYREGFVMDLLIPRETDGLAGVIDGIDRSGYATLIDQLKKNGGPRKLGAIGLPWWMSKKVYDGGTLTDVLFETFPQPLVTGPSSTCLAKGH